MLRPCFAYEDRVSLLARRLGKLRYKPLIDRLVDFGPKRAVLHGLLFELLLPFQLDLLHHNGRVG